MKYKKIMLILITAIFLASIASVCAADANDTLVASEDTNTIGLSVDKDIIEDNLQTSEENTKLGVEETDETLSSKTDSEILTADQLTYSDLRDKIGSGGDINLTKGTYTYNDGDGETIKITTSGVINGNGAVIDMNHSGYRAFEITTYSVTIKNLTIKNANYTGNGGAIYFGSSGTVINCNFINNSATQNGGAVYFYTFTTGTIVNCNFTDNQATGDGGAVFFSSYGTVRNCSFTNNFATQNGGAVNFFNKGITCTIVNCNFTDNQATGDGGAVYFNGSCSATNCSFTDNKAMGAESWGGAVYIHYSGSVTNCSFTNNAATKSGGAIRIFSGSVTKCNFNNNTASDEGGAIITESGTVTNCNFVNNTATKYGGAVYFNDDCEMANCNFVNNTATNNGGGAVFFSCGGSVTNCSFTLNTASRYSGAVYFTLAGSVTNCNFTDNKATGSTGYAGAVFFRAKGTVTNCSFVNNTAGESGGAIRFYTTSTVKNCNFTGNNAPYGSAIYFYSGSAVKTVSNSCLLNNRANAKELQIIKNENSITITFTGNDNLLNAIYSKGGVSLTNVTYWGEDGVTNTGSSTIKPIRSDSSANQNITVRVVVNDELVFNKVEKTDKNGMIVLDISAGENYYISARHEADSYYTEIQNLTTSMKFYANVTAQTTHNKTVNMTAKSNILSGVIYGKLLFIVPNGENITATYAGNDTWWAEYTFDEYTTYQVNATYSGLDNVTVNNGTISITKTPTNITVENATVNLFIFDSVDAGTTLTPAGAGNLTFTSSNTSVAIVEKGKIKALTNGTAVITVSFPGNENYFAAENKTINVTVNLKDAIISVNNSTLDLFVDDNFTVVASTNPAGLKVTFVQDDSGVYTVDGNGNVTALREGTGHILVKVGGDGVYAENTTEITVSVSKIPTGITLTNETLDLKVNDMVDGLANLTPADAGNLTFISSDEDIVFVADGAILARSKGNATVTVSFAGNDKYAAAESNITVTVSLNDASVSVENSTLNLKFNDTFDIVPATSPKGLAVNYTSSNETVVTVDNKGRITAVGTGSAVITVSVGGDGVYVLNSTTVDVIVKKELNLNATTFAIIGNMTLIVSGFENATGNVSITVGEYNYAPSIMMGMVFVSLPKLNENVTAYIYYPGDGNYYNASTTVDIIAKKDLNLTIVADPIYVGENATVIVNGFENATGNVMVIAGMNFNNVTIINGTATTIIPGLNKTTTVMAFYMGDNNYNMNYTSVNITVLPKENLTISASAKQISVGEKATVIVTGLENATGDVTVHINNKTYSAPIVDGTAKVVIPDLTKNTTAYVDYSGDRRYNPSNTTTEITVNKIKTTLTAKSITTTYNVNKNLVITLEDANGGPVSEVNITVDLNGAKTYTTDKKGQITVSTKGLAPKAYTAKVTFKGNEKYIDSNKNVKVTVKKATPKITAKVKTFKTTTKTKKYSIVLKNNVNKPIKKATVYLKVNGKTYKATTNSKGKATFKIAKLNKAGKFKATVTYKGNKYYNKATKKVIIKVKSVWKTVSKGSKNSAIVKKIQRALKNHGYYLEYNGRYLMVDGIYWDYTEMAVKEFQNDKVLKVTGKVDEKTAKKLGII